MDLLLQRVLTAEFIHGCRVDDVEAMKKMGVDVDDVRYLHICDAGRWT